MNAAGEIVQYHRKTAGLTQAALAKLAGVGKTVVWDVEHGKESVQWDTLQRIFRVLNISVVWQSPLLTRTAAIAPRSAARPLAAPPAVPTPPSTRRRGR